MTPNGKRDRFRHALKRAHQPTLFHRSIRISMGNMVLSVEGIAQQCSRSARRSRDQQLMHHIS